MDRQAARCGIALEHPGLSAHSLVVDTGVPCAGASAPAVAGARQGLHEAAARITSRSLVMARHGMPFYLTMQPGKRTQTHWRAERSLDQRFHLPTRRATIGANASMLVSETM